MHGDVAQTKPSSDCPLHASAVQISISAPEPEPEEKEAETGNHRPGEQAGGDTGSMTASRESLARYHGGDGGVGICSNNTLSHVPRTSIFKRPGRKRRHGDETFDHDISAFFPANLDFLALQEVFDHGSTTRLRHQLHRYFPYVLSDVGRYGWKGCCSRFKFLNSGLMLASRYPILDARFECYPNGRGEDALAAKGALFAKVRNYCCTFSWLHGYCNELILVNTIWLDVSGFVGVIRPSGLMAFPPPPPNTPDHFNPLKCAVVSCAVPRNSPHAVAGSEGTLTRINFVYEDRVPAGNGRSCGFVQIVLKRAIVPQPKVEPIWRWARASFCKR